MTSGPLQRLFEPRSIVVVGGSDQRGSVGRVLLHNLYIGGFDGELCIVNNKHTHVRNQPSYPSVHALGRAVDLAIIAVPADGAVQAVAECAELGIAHALVITAGFAERGPEGAKLQQALLDAAAGKVRVLGPNSVGFVRTHACVHAFFGPTLAKTGKLALISQSGAVCTAIVDWATAREIGFSTVVSIGGAADLGFGEVLDYLALDPKTDAILLYLEGPGDARRFLSGLRAAARMKPVVALKAGRKSEGQRAATSHTGALVGDDAVFAAALRRAGALRADDLDELFAVADLLARTQRTRGDRLAIVTNAGGLGVMAADTLADEGLSLAKLAPDTLQALDRVLPEFWSHGNPVDLIGDATPDRYGKALTPVLADAGVDGVLVLLSPQSMTEPESVADAVIAARDHSDKPVFASFMGGVQVETATHKLEHAGVPALATPQAAIEAFSQLSRFACNQRLLLQVPEARGEPDHVELERARAIVREALAAGRTSLSLPESKALLAAFSLEVNPSEAAASADQAAAAAARLGYPVAMKIDSPDIQHKTDVGGVKLGLADEAAVREAFERMIAQARRQQPEAKLRGVTIERMAKEPNGRELLVGIARDPLFGPVISVGAGGVLVELMADQVVGLPPLNRALAADMIARTRAKRWLQAFRGQPPADTHALETALIRLSELAAELPEVQELDINPLIVSEHGALALDARVALQAPPPGLPRYAHLAIEPRPAHLAHTLALEGGGELLVRPIRPEDASLEQSFVRALSLDSRYSRFHQGMNELTPRMLMRFSQLDYDREMAFVAVAGDAANPTIVGVSRYVCELDGKRCEFALVVADAYQRKRVGSALMRALIDRARGQGISVMFGDVLTTNTKMLELCRKLGFVVMRHEDGATLKRVELALS